MDELIIKEQMSGSLIIRILGCRFKQYRIAHCITQQEMAERSGVNTVTIRNFENGKAYNITMASFMALMRVLDKIERFDDLLPPMAMPEHEAESIMTRQKKRVKHRVNDTTL